MTYGHDTTPYIRLFKQVFNRPGLPCAIGAISIWVAGLIVLFHGRNAPKYVPFILGQYERVICWEPEDVNKIMCGTVVPCPIRNHAYVSKNGEITFEPRS